MFFDVQLNAKVLKILNVPNISSKKNFKID